MDAGKLNPGLKGQLGHRVGQQGPQALGPDEFLACRRDISPVHGGAGMHRGDQRRRVALLDSGLAQNGAGLVGQCLSPVPLAARHRYQRSLAQRDGQSLVRAGLLPRADGSLERRVGAVEVTGKDTCQPLVERRRRRHDVLRGASPHGLVGVGVYLLDPTPAHERPEDGGVSLGVRVIGPRRVAVLPVIDHVGPSLGLGRPPGHGGKKRGQHGSHRMPFDPTAIFQPPEPPVEGGEPALPVDRHPEPFHQASGGVNVPGCDGVLQRILWQIIAHAPTRGATPQDSRQVGLTAVQLGPEHVAKQMVVAVPLPPPVQRHQQQVRPLQVRQRRAGPGQVEHRIAQWPGHPLQHRGPGQEYPLSAGDPLQELRLHVLADQPVVTAEGDRRARERAALPEVEGREVQPGRPSLGPPVELSHIRSAQHDARVTHQ